MGKVLVKRLLILSLIFASVAASSLAATSAKFIYPRFSVAQAQALLWSVNHAPSGNPNAKALFSAATEIRTDLELLNEHPPPSP